MERHARRKLLAHAKKIATDFDPASHPNAINQLTKLQVSAKNLVACNATDLSRCNEYRAILQESLNALNSAKTEE